MPTRCWSHAVGATTGWWPEGDFDGALAQFGVQGYPLQEADVVRLSPFMRKHINVHGHCSFYLPDLPGGRRALRNLDDRRAMMISLDDSELRSCAQTGEMVVTHALGEPEKSSVVRVRDGMLSETDGPYVESKEYMAGYYLIECADQARANQIAGMMPDAKFNAVEVRPIVFSSGPGA